MLVALVRTKSAGTRESDNLRNRTLVHLGEGRYVIRTLVNTVSNFFLKEEEKVLFCSRKSILLFLLRVSILDVTLTRSFCLLQGVIETVKDFFSPAWLVDLFKGNQRSQPVEIDFDQQDEHNEVSQTIDESYTSNSNLRSSRKPAEVSTATTVGNGQLGSLGPGYFSSILRERGLSSETPSTSRPSRTFGLSSGNDRYGEASTSSVRSEESESEVPSSRRASESVRPETVEVGFYTEHRFRDLLLS